jgi:DNA-binding CsgD family transcriptional regulator
MKAMLDMCNTRYNGAKPLLTNFAGKFYLARSERFKIPVLDTFQVGFGANALAAGLGLPPAPAQVIEVQGLSGGVSGLADTIDYDPRKNTIPKVRFNIGTDFQLVEVISFGGEIWAETLAGGITGSGGVEVGPLSIDVIENLSIGLGVQDGPYQPYEDAGIFVQGKRSLLFYMNANLDVSLIGTIKGKVGFAISMIISPALWEKRGGFNSFEELVDFISLNISVAANGLASVNIPMTDYSISEAEVKLDIQFEPGVDQEYAPFGFKSFKFIITERAMGMVVAQETVDLLQMYPGLKEWIKDQVATAKNKVSAQTQRISLSLPDNLMTSDMESSIMAMNTFLASRETSGVAMNPFYEPEYELIGFGETVASSEREPAPAQPRIRAICAAFLKYAILSHMGELKALEAEAAFDELKALVDTETPDFLPNLKAYTVKLRIYNGEQEAIKDWLDEYFVLDVERIELFRLFQHFTTARVYIAAGKYQDAKRLLTMLADYGKNLNRPIDEAEALTLLSVYYSVIGNKNNAESYLIKALEILSDYKYVTLVADEGAAIKPMLKRILTKVSAPDYSGKLTRSYVNEVLVSAHAKAKEFPYYLQKKSDENGTVKKLSRRQNEILALLSQGITTSEICRQTGLSLSTVKTHLYFTYKKLGVNSALDAVLRARGEGIIR